MTESIIDQIKIAAYALDFRMCIELLALQYSGFKCSDLQMSSIPEAHGIKVLF